MMSLMVCLSCASLLMSRDVAASTFKKSHPSRLRRHFPTMLNGDTSGRHPDINAKSLLAKVPTEADFVVVGAGTAGSLLADRLSRIGSVLILECGSETPISVRRRLPGAGCTFDQLPQSTLDACGDRCIEEMEGDDSTGETSGLNFRQGPGGTSVMAVGAHFRGGDKYWQDLANLHGAHWLLSEDEIGNLEHEMSVRKTPTAVDKDHLVFAQALSRDLSLVSVNYTNTDEAFVFPRYQDESGWSTNSYTQFLKKALKKENVHMLTEACVQRLIKGDDGGAPSLEVQHGSKKIRASARREVILAAGALGSPALLQRSGLSTAPLRDQADVRVAWHCSRCKYKDDFVKALHEFFRKDHAGKPPVALTLPGFDAGALVDLHGVPALILASTEIASADSAMVSDTVVNKLEDKNKSVFEVHIILLQPHSFEGQVSRDGEMQLPLRLTNRKDLDAAVHGIRLVRKVVKKHNELEKLGLGQELHPGPQYQTDSELRKILQSEESQVVQSFQSATASCRLRQVVDDQMRVVGMPRVRVADASVLPKPPLGRTLFPTLIDRKSVV